jgi:hypothetical protein
MKSIKLNVMKSDVQIQKDVIEEIKGDPDKESS